MNIAMLITACSMGLAGSLHCSGMCGPIIWVMPFQQTKGWTRVLGISLYHIGRISVYALLGVLIYSFKGMLNPGWQQYFSIFAGILLLITGLLTFFPKGSFSVTMPWTSYVTKALSKVMAQRHPMWLLATGALNGLLPCGMVYMALAAAVTSSGPVEAALTMYAFGLGTAPALIAITILRGRLSFSRLSARRWVPFTMLLFGMLLVLRGANLGIPYLSPKAVQQQTSVHNAPVMKCCHHGAE